MPHATNMNKYLDRFVVWCLYGVLVTPLIFQQALMHPLVILKTVFFQVFIEIAFISYLPLAVVYKEYRPRVTPLFIAVCALFSAIVISGVFGVNGARSIWSVPERMTGIVLMAHLVAYYTMLSGMRRSFSWRRYLATSVAISFFVALIPVVQLFIPSIFFDKMNDRVSGTIGNAIFLASYLFFHVFIAAWFARTSYAEKGMWWLYALVGAFDFMVICLTQTRGAALAMIVSLFALSVYTIRDKRSDIRIHRFVYGVWACIILFVGVFWITRTHVVWQGVPIMGRIAREGFQADNRLIAWRAGLQAFTERPLFGWGWENFYIAFNNYYNPRLLRSGFNETFFDRPHNVFVQFLTETGIVGFSAFVFLLFCALYYARKNKWLIALLAAYITQNFFAFDSVSSYMMFFAVVAFIDFEYHKNKEFILPSYKAWGMQGMALLVFCGAGALYSLYFFNYRAYAASRLEWQSVNYFVNARMPEGLDYMRQALAASTPYHVYIAKDLYPNIALLYKQGLPLPDVRNLITWAVRGMQETADAEPLNYGFWIGFADMMPPIASLDLKYLDQGLIVLDHADSLSPHRQSTLYVRSKILNLKGDKKGAQQAMAHAVALDPEVGDAHFFYGLLLLEGGDKEGGVRELARARELGREPKNVNEASVAGGNLGDLGAYKESALYFQKALLFEPDNAEMTMKLGLAS